MADVPLVGPSYNLDSRPASVQRTINLVPVPQEPGNERTAWVLQDVPGLRLVTLTEGGGEVTGTVETIMLAQFDGDGDNQIPGFPDWVLQWGSFQPGRFADAIQNDVPNQPQGAVELASPLTIASAGQAFTADFWLKYVSGAWGSGITLLGDAVAVGFRVVDRPLGQARVTVAGNFVDTTSPVDLIDGSWHYIRIVRRADGDTVIVTVDGAVNATMSAVGAVGMSNPSRIGSAVIGSPVFQLDGLRIVRNKAISIGAHPVPSSPPVEVTS